MPPRESSLPLVAVPSSMTMVSTPDFSDSLAAMSVQFISLALDSSTSLVAISPSTYITDETVVKVSSVEQKVDTPSVAIPLEISILVMVSPTNSTGPFSCNSVLVFTPVYYGASVVPILMKLDPAFFDLVSLLNAVTPTTEGGTTRSVSPKA